MCAHHIHSQWLHVCPSHPLSMVPCVPITSTLNGSMCAHHIHTQWFHVCPSHPHSMVPCVPITSTLNGSMCAHHIHTQANKLESLLRVGPSNLVESCKLIEDAILSSPIPPNLEDDILSRISEQPLAGHFLAVRSSGTDEDSGAHSFAGECEEVRGV